jgi:hypothetical protein
MIFLDARVKNCKVDFGGDIRYFIAHLLDLALDESKKTIEKKVNLVRYKCDTDGSLDEAHECGHARNFGADLFGEAWNEMVASVTAKESSACLTISRD